jgi:hypothetical protein
VHRWLKAIFENYVKTGVIPIKKLTIWRREKELFP